ncbi:MAG TPA: glycosyltransferase family 2 protein [Abditibacteriaceae bacterium]
MNFILEKTAPADRDEATANAAALNNHDSATDRVSDVLAPEISVVVPVYNEEENVPAMHEKLQGALRKLGLAYEILYVDDGSRDRSFELLDAIAAQDAEVKLVRFRRNFGQTAAMAAGMQFASGRVIIPIDADLQNDPADIPRLLAKMDEGYDVVSGWRKKRKDDSIRRIPSRIANKLISRVTGVALHDYGCSLKAYRADIMKDVTLYGEMHRFIPAYAHMVGARVTEIPVNHLPRVAGVSKYGIGRVFRVLLDLLVVKFLGGYGSKPIYFFGGAGLWSFGLGASLWTLVLAQKLLLHVNINRNPLFYVGILLFLAGGQFLMMGLLAEMNMRTYHESQGKTPYTIAETRNI